MEENTRSYLESLTTRELIRMADREGIDIPPDLERVFIIQELLENDRPEDLPEPEERGRLTPVPLPKQYNITYLEVLLRDPLWVFAFWEIKKYDREHFEKSGDFEGYCLKVSSVGSAVSPDRKKTPEKAFFPETVFTVSVGAEDTAWYLGFPPQGGEFYVELCVRLRDSREPGRDRADLFLKPLAASRPFFIPRLFNPPENEEMLKNPLIRLSGAEYFSILRNTDRFSQYGIS
ncbi:MAG: DUF4912 domain-containing protein [Treponema sp.]|jgi:hypothetical protein|nr:DUF4912 domain-containing protein [Treponema sp.]